VRFRCVLKFKVVEHIDQVRDATSEVLAHMYDHIALKGGENIWHTTTRPLWDWGLEDLHRK
jgi:hypothetical protein